MNSTKKERSGKQSVDPLLKPHGIDRQLPFGDEAVVHFDGSCGPTNPGGVARAGWTIDLPDGSHYEGSRLIAQSGTNNLAEFGALLNAAQHLSELRIDRAIFYGDSALVVNCMRGIYRLKAKNLVPIMRQTIEILKNMRWNIIWIPRKRNQTADRLSNQPNKFLTNVQPLPEPPG